VITRFDKTAPPLRGRVSLPRDARKDEEIVLVFAVGDLAAQAKAAGAKYVGGEDLIPLVRMPVLLLLRTQVQMLNISLACRYYLVKSRQQK
jgi:hypothetical protein